MFVKDWTEAHELEAMRALFRLADEIMGSRLPSEPRARNLCTAVCSTESEFRAALRRVCTPSRAELEVRRVDALATGRLVRKRPKYGVMFKPHTSRKVCRSAIERATGRSWGSPEPWSRGEAHAIAKQVPGSVVVLHKRILRKENVE
jgi:hypothetical protein